MPPRPGSLIQPVSGMAARNKIPATGGRRLAEGVTIATAKADRDRIAAIGVGGHAPSPVFVDANLRPVAAALPWFDDRCRLERDRLLETLGRPPASGGERLMVQLAARAMWLRRTAADDFAHAASVLHSGDYLVAHLTGQRVMTTPKIPEVFAAADLPPKLLPERECRSGEMVGQLSTELANQWGFPAAVSVVSGGLDSFLASVGSGIREPGDACLNSGSNSVVALLARENGAARFEWNGLPLLSRPSWPGGRVLQLAGRLARLHEPLDDALSEAARLPPPLADDRLLADFFEPGQREGEKIRDRLSQYLQNHSAVELLRLVLDAIFLGQRMMLEELENESVPARRICCVGGLAAYPAIHQLQADVLGRTIEVPPITDSGARGAAMLACVALEIDAVSEVASPKLHPTMPAIRARECGSLRAFVVRDRRSNPGWARLMFCRVLNHQRRGTRLFVDAATHGAKIAEG